MELFEGIRRDHRREDLSIRELATRHGVHRRTVRQALASAEPPPRKVPERVAPKLELIAPLIDVMLRVNLDAPRKQQAGVRTKVLIFTLRLSSSGKAVHRAFGT